MGRHDDDRTRDRYHDNRSRHSSKEQQSFSLRQLKERARKEMIHRNHRDDRDRDNYHRNDRRDRNRSASPRKRRNVSRSRSKSPNFRHPRSSNDDFERKRYRNESHSNYNNRKNNDKSNFDRRKDQNNDNSFSEGKSQNPNGDEEKQAEIKPNFELTGSLAKDTNTFNGVVVKYNEPLEAKKPFKHWRLYPFKGDTALDFIPVYRQSAYLLGRDRKVADIPIDHPSCSKQHAVLQYRSIEFEREDGTKGRKTRPYIIDLDSANGTFVNNKQIDPRRFVELFERDIIKFGFSTREYVLLHEQSEKDNEPESDTEIFG